MLKSMLKVLNKSMKYCLGSGCELLSAVTVLAVCHDPSVFLVRSFSLSMIVALSKSIKVHACFAKLMKMFTVTLSGQT